MKYRVKIRRTEGLEVRPEAEQIDGKVFNFIHGWVIEDRKQYHGEIAWIPRDPNYPDDGPTWIASGDLEVEPYEDYVKRMEALGWTVLPGQKSLYELFKKEGYSYVLEGDTYGPAGNGYPSNENKDGGDGG